MTCEVYFEGWYELRKFWKALKLKREAQEAYNLISESCFLFSPSILIATVDLFWQAQKSCEKSENSMLDDITHTSSAICTFILEY